MEEVRALTLKQPWAWAAIQGYKDVENRSWTTSHRGLLLIHAGRRFDPDGFQFLWELGLHTALPMDLPLGRLIGSVHLEDVVTGSPSKWAARGAWHWVLSKPREFRTPILCRGGQKLFFPAVNARALGQARRQAIRHRRRV
jgi:hypothetical protein